MNRSNIPPANSTSFATEGGSNSSTNDKKPSSPKSKSRTKREKSTEVLSDVSASSSNSTEWQFEIETGQNIDLSHVSTKKKPKRLKSETSKATASPTSPTPITPIVEAMSPQQKASLPTILIPPQIPQQIVNRLSNIECTSCHKLLSYIAELVQERSKLQQDLQTQHNNMQQLQQLVQRLLEQNEQYRIQLEILKSQNQILLQQPQTVVDRTTIAPILNGNDIANLNASTATLNLYTTAVHSPLNHILSNLLQNQSQDWSSDSQSQHESTTEENDAV